MTSPLARAAIIDETSDCIVVDKPPHIAVHPSKPDGKRTLWHELRELLAFEIANGGQVSIINRLDRETSGLTLIAKHHEAARRFSMQMERREIHKEYLALVWGWPERDEYEIDAPITRQGEFAPSRIYLKQAVHPSGAKSLTTIFVEKRFARESANGGRFSLVRAFPKTGRMHQIRVHLAHIGHAIVGDKIYGPDESCYLEFIETGWTSRLAEKLLLPRHALHSTRLFIDAGEMSHDWNSPLARDLADWMSGAR